MFNRLLSTIGRILGRPQDEQRRPTALDAIKSTSAFKESRQLFDAMDAMSADGVDADELPSGKGDFGKTADNPIPTRTVFGSTAYLARLRAPDGTKVQYARTGSTSSAATHHPVDIYEISHADGHSLTRLYLSPYQKRNSQKAPHGLTLLGSTVVADALQQDPDAPTSTPRPGAALDPQSPAGAAASLDTNEADDEADEDDDFAIDDPDEYPGIDDPDVRRAMRAEEYGSSDDAFRHWMPIYYRYEGKQPPNALSDAAAGSYWAEYLDLRLRHASAPNLLYMELYDLSERGMVEAYAYRVRMHANGEIRDVFEREAIHRMMLWAWENDSIEALVYLAEQTQEGSEFVEEDAEEALVLYRRAAELNHRKAAREAGLLLHRRKQLVEAERFLKIAISLGDRRSKYELGRLYIWSWQPSRRDEGVPLIFEAAKDEDYEAKRQAALFYENGVGTPVNFEAARRYYEQTSSTTWSAISLGEMHRDGRGGPVNVAEALRLFNYARESRNFQASYHLGRIWRDGKLVPQDLPKSLTYFEEAAANNVPQAVFQLAIMLRDGTGTMPDPVRADDEFARAAELGCTEAIDYLKAFRSPSPPTPTPNAKRYVVLDFETTGLSPDRGDKIIEIGAVEIVDGVITRRHATLVDPEMSIGAHITRITSIDDSMVAGAPHIETALPTLLDFIGDATLVAHNIVFELRFLSYECRRLRLALPDRNLCTLKLARRLYPGLPNYKLGSLLGEFKIRPDGPLHRALPDAKATAELLLIMQQKHPSKQFS